MKAYIIVLISVVALSLLIMIPQPVNASSVKILAYVEYTDYDQEYVNALSAINSTFGSDYLLTELWDHTKLSSKLSGKGVLLVPEQETASLSAMETIGTSWSTTLSDFVAEGGVIIICDYTGGSHGILTGAGLMSISSTNYITGSTVYLVDPTNALAENVSNTFTAPNGALSFVTSETNVVLNDSTYPVVIHKQSSSGHIALIGFDYYASDSDADQILGNAVGLWKQEQVVTYTAGGTLRQENRLYLLLILAERFLADRWPIMIVVGILVVAVSLMLHRRKH